MNDNYKLNNEQSLVLLTSRLTFSENDVEKLKGLVSQKLNWYKVFEYSLKNKVVILIWQNLIKHNLEEQIPRELSQVYQMFHLGIKKRNECFMNDLNAVLNALESNGIVYSTLKGAYLLDILYKDYGIRIMNDLDIMIRNSDAAVVQKIMESLGYKQGDRDFRNKTVLPLTREKQILWKTKMSNLFPFIKVNNSDYCLFTKVDYACGLDYERNFEPVNIMLSEVEKDNEAGCYVLRPSYFFIHLCCHLYKEASSATDIFLHKDINLIKFCDIREYILQKMNSITLNSAISFAMEHKLEKAIYYVLYYLREIYNDGYETSLLNNLNIADDGFLDKFGSINYGYDIGWKKSFWERLFADGNEDEVEIKPKYFDI